MQLVCKNMLREWWKVAEDERKTRYYFEKLERGETDTDIDLDIVSKDGRWLFVFMFKTG